MNKTLSVGLLALSCALLSAHGAEARRQQGGDPVGDTTAACGATVFDDHFDRSALGPAWQAQTNDKLTNGELEVYVPDHVTLDNGGLELTATPGGPHGYISGRVHSAQTYRYGCFFITARLPPGNGIWPALWLRTPGLIGGELDLLEQRGARPGEFQSTVHHWQAGQHLDQSCTLVRFASTPPWPQGKQPCGGRETVIPGSGDFSQRLHTFGVIWTPTQATWLLDGRPYFSTTDRVTDKPMIIVLNLAVGGVMDAKHQPDATTPFPATMEVREVKVTSLR